MIKVWIPDITSEETYPEAHYEDTDFQKELMSRQPVRGKFPDVKIFIESEFPPPDYFECGPKSFVSEKLADILRCHEKVKVEFHAVEVFFRGGLYTKQQFFYFNVVDEADGFDFKKSQYELLKGYAYRLEELVLKPVDEHEHEHILFYLENLISSILCIVDALAEEIQASGCTGMKFIDPQDWGRRRKLFGWS